MLAAEHMKMEDALFKEYLIEHHYDVQVLSPSLCLFCPGSSLTIILIPMVSSKMGLLREGTLESQLHPESSHDEEKKQISTT